MIFNKLWVLNIIFKTLFVITNYPTSNMQDLIQQNQNCHGEIASHTPSRTLGHAKSLWFCIKACEMHFRLIWY